MKHKVGDKVRIKSKEWYEENKDKFGEIDSCGFTEMMQHYCGKVATIVDMDNYSYLIDLDNGSYSWCDGIFEDDEPQVRETLLQDIANVIKSNNMGIQVSEQDGKLIIEPLKVDEDDLPIDTPCMVKSDNNDEWKLRYYAGKCKCYIFGGKTNNEDTTSSWDCIIPWDKFDPNNIEVSLKHNIVKSE